MFSDESGKCHEKGQQAVQDQSNYDGEELGDDEGST